MAVYDVFISYKSEELSEALWMKNVLESNGISCWMAPGNIPGGSNYAQEIPSAIRDCKIFVLMLSSRAQESMWISKEINMALNEHKMIMPFMLEDCALYNEFNFYLSDVQRYNAFQSKSEAIKKMIREIKAIKGCEEMSFVEKNTMVSSAKDQDRNPLLLKNTTNNLWPLIAITYLLFLPAGVVTTISYLVRNRIGTKYKEKVYGITKKLCILSSIFGFFLIIYAVIFHSHCHEALYCSFIGIFIEYIFFV